MGEIIGEKGDRVHMYRCTPVNLYTCTCVQKVYIVQARMGEIIGEMGDSVHIRGGRYIEKCNKLRLVAPS